MSAFHYRKKTRKKKKKEKDLELDGYNSGELSDTIEPSKISANELLDRQYGLNLAKFIGEEQKMTFLSVIQSACYEIETKKDDNYLKASRCVKKASMFKYWLYVGAGGEEHNETVQGAGGAVEQKIREEDLHHAENRRDGRGIAHDGNALGRDAGPVVVVAHGQHPNLCQQPQKLDAVQWPPVVVAGGVKVEQNPRKEVEDDAAIAQGGDGGQADSGPPFTLLLVDVLQHIPEQDLGVGGTEVDCQHKIHTVQHQIDRNRDDICVGKGPHTQQIQQDKGHGQHQAPRKLLQICRH